jgi:7-keto-8-aminopelargonate synthetase-like enzyme
MWHSLFAHGMYVNLALPPGTPDGTSLLRASITAGHTEEDIVQALNCFAATLARPSAAEALAPLVVPDG